MTDPQIAVVIVNYRTADLAVAAAGSVLEQVRALGGVCILVDNNSGDGSAARLAAFAKSAPDLVRLVASPENRGFSAGNNIAFQCVRAPAYLLLNSDARAEPGALAAMLDKAGLGVGLVTPTILDESGVVQSSRFRSHSLLAEFVDGAHSGPVTRLFRRGEIPIPPDDADTEPDWVSFAAVLVTRAAIDAVGPMDERYFLYFEDCDYGLRIKSAGLRTVFAPAAAFIHKGGASTGVAADHAALRRVPAYYYRARSRFFRKWRGPLGPLAANLAWQSGRLIAHARVLFGRAAPAVSRNRARDQWIGWLG